MLLSLESAPSAGLSQAGALGGRFSNPAGRLLGLRLGFMLHLRTGHFQEQAHPYWYQYSRTRRGTQSCVAREGSSPLPPDPRRLPSPLRWMRSGGRSWSSPAVSTLLPPPAVLQLSPSTQPPLSGIYSGPSPEWLASAPAPAGLLLMQSRGAMGVGGGWRGTCGVTAGPGCRPFLSPRPASFFWVGRRRLLHQFGGAGTLGS